MLAGPYPGEVDDGDDPHLAVADPAGAGRGDDGVDQAFGVGVVDDDLDPNLGDEVDAVLGAAVHLLVAPLPAVALRLAHGHPVDAERGGTVSR